VTTGIRLSHIRFAVALLDATMRRMRVLFSTTAGAGHFGPLVPLARACRDAGHDVLVAAPASFASAVIAAGFDHAPFDDVPPEVMGAVFGRLPGLSTAEANAVVIREVFARLDAQAALPGVSATIESWKPDIVLSEPAEFGSWAAAERSGVPQIVVSIGLAAMGDTFLGYAAEPLAELRMIAGLPEDPQLDRLTAVPCFTFVPATLDGADTDAAGSPWRFRDASDRNRDARLPQPWGDPQAHLVYASFGSVTGTVGPFAAIYPAVVEALAGIPERVLLTTGEGFDPESLGALPKNIHVERWWPQVDIMPACSAVVGHGGFGTTMVTLSSGLPQVVVPLFAADQFLNGARVDEVGAGICLDDGIEAAATALPDALRRVLDEPSYRKSAERIADEIAALPDVSAAVPIIEKFASSIAEVPAIANPAP